MISIRTLFHHFLDRGNNWQALSYASYIGETVSNRVSVICKMATQITPHLEQKLLKLTQLPSNVSIWWRHHVPQTLFMQTIWVENYKIIRYIITVNLNKVFHLFSVDTIWGMISKLTGRQTPLSGNTKGSQQCLAFILFAEILFVFSAQRSSNAGGLTLSVS